MITGVSLFCAGLTLCYAPAAAQVAPTISAAPAAASPADTPASGTAAWSDDVTRSAAPAAPSTNYVAPAAASPFQCPAIPETDIAAGKEALDVLPGEIRLDGLPIESLDTTSGKFSLNVCSYSTTKDARVWLTAPKMRSIAVDHKTILYTFGDRSSQIALHDVDEHPYHVTVVGEDRSDGSLLARVLWVQRVSPVETAFVKQFHDFRPNRTCGAPMVRVARAFVYTLGHNFPVDVVEAKMSTVRVRVALAWGHVGDTESLGGMIHDYGAIAAINGSFFDAYNAGVRKLPNNELICMSEPVYRANIGTVLGFTPDGEAQMARSPVADALHRLDPAYPDQWNADGDIDRTLFWQRVTEGLGAGPRLVRDGEIDLDPHSEGFHSAEVLDGSAMRSAVGITSNGWLLMVNAQSTIPQLAHIMKALGCSQAMNLDGGSSSGLWVHGRYLRVPGRYLSNALVIVHR